MAPHQQTATKPDTTNTDPGDDQARGNCCPLYHEAVELVGRRWTGAILRVLMDGLPVAQALRHSRGASIAPGTLGSNVGPGFNASPFTRGSTAATRWVAISIAACRLHRLALRRPGVGKAWFRRGERAAMWPLSRVERLEIKGGLDPPLPVRGTGSAAYAGSSSGHRFGGHRDCSGDTPKVHTADP